MRNGILAAVIASLLATTTHANDFPNREAKNGWVMSDVIAVVAGAYGKKFNLRPVFIDVPEKNRFFTTDHGYCFVVGMGGLLGNKRDLVETVVGLQTEQVMVQVGLISGLSDKPDKRWFVGVISNSKEAIVRARCVWLNYEKTKDQ